MIVFGGFEFEDEDDDDDEVWLVFLEGFNIISLVFLGWMDMLFMDKNWEVMLRRCCVLC